MNFVMSNQKQEDKYFPITCEQVFDLPEDDISRTSVLHFQTPMTKSNQAIYKEARVHKKNKEIENCWLMNGSIYIKRIGHAKEALRIDNIDQLKDVMKSIKANVIQVSSSTAMDVMDQ